MASKCFKTWCRARKRWVLKAFDGRMLFQGDGLEADEAYAMRFLKAAAEKALV